MRNQAILRHVGQSSCRRGDSTVLVGDERTGVVTGLQVAAQLAQRLGIQRGGERLGQGLELASLGAGQAGKDCVRGLLRHHAIEDASPVETEYVAAQGFVP